MANNREGASYPAALLWSVPLALVAALGMALFLWIYRSAWTLLWSVLPGALPGVPRWGWTLALALLGGLLVGLIRRYLAPRSETPLLTEVPELGGPDYRTAPYHLLAGLLSLLSGASVSPEGPLAHFSGGLGSWLGERLRYPLDQIRVLSASAIAVTFGGLFSNPIAGGLLALEFTGLAGFSFYALLLGTLLSATLGGLLMHLLGAFDLVTPFAFGAYESLRWVDLVPALLLGVLGVPVAWLFGLLDGALRKVAAPLKGQTLLKPVAGALIFGSVGALLPLTLFSGEREISGVIATGAQLGAVTLLLLFAAKLILLSVCLHTGFAGGVVFPVLFAGAALGMAVHELIPAIPPAVALICAMAALSGALLRMPLGVIVFLVGSAGMAAAPLVIIAALTGSVGTLLLPQVGDARAAWRDSDAEQGAGRAPAEAPLLSFPSR